MNKVIYFVFGVALLSFVAALFLYTHPGHATPNHGLLQSPTLGEQSPQLGHSEYPLKQDFIPQNY
ncbi:hypothetical protein [Dongshaea marina]|uniref:hypothetical protein n=1 Tax=Dongshaea marina TaxID=2047966 RepID=UPI000D3E6E65|nr:hypothetical protein [Dongshaea marina]